MLQNEISRAHFLQNILTLPCPYPLHTPPTHKKVIKKQIQMALWLQKHAWRVGKFKFAPTGAIIYVWKHKLCSWEISWPNSLWYEGTIDFLAGCMLFWKYFLRFYYLQKKELEVWSDIEETTSLKDLCWETAFFPPLFVFLSKNSSIFLMPLQRCYCWWGNCKEFSWLCLEKWYSQLGQKAC